MALSGKCREHACRQELWDLKVGVPVSWSTRAWLLEGVAQVTLDHIPLPLFSSEHSAVSEISFYCVHRVTMSRTRLKRLSKHAQVHEQSSPA